MVLTYTDINIKKQRIDIKKCANIYNKKNINIMFFFFFAKQNAAIYSAAEKKRFYNAAEKYGFTVQQKNQCSKTKQYVMFAALCKNGKTKKNTCLKIVRDQ